MFRCFGKGTNPIINALHASFRVKHSADHTQRTMSYRHFYFWFAAVRFWRRTLLTNLTKPFKGIRFVIGGLRNQLLFVCTLYFCFIARKGSPQFLIQVIKKLLALTWCTNEPVFLWRKLQLALLKLSSTRPGYPDNRDQNHQGWQMVWPFFWFSFPFGRKLQLALLKLSSTRPGYPDNRDQNHQSWLLFFFRDALLGSVDFIFERTWLSGQ